MAISGKKIMFLGVFMAVLLAVATEGAVTVYNPVRIPVSVLVDGERVQVESDLMSIDITEAEQKINITTLAGDSIIALDVTDHDIIILFPEAFVAANAPVSVRVVPVPSDFSLAGEPLAQP